MGGSPSKKENFKECMLTQENIDKVYSNFSEFTKLKDGKSNTFIGVRGLQKVVKPNKELGRKIHEFLSQQSVSQTLDFEVFLYFEQLKYSSFSKQLSQNLQKVEFFLQGATFIRQDQKYREYSFVEMFGLLSFYSNLTKNKQTDKEYINRLHISYRSGLEFFKELHGIIAALNGIYKQERDELVAKRLNAMVFGDKYELTFQDFIANVNQKLPNVSKIIQNYFKRTFYVNKPYKVEDEKDKEKGNPPPKTSEILNHNALSNLQLSINQFSEFPHRENIFNLKEFNARELNEKELNYKKLNPKDFYDDQEKFTFSLLNQAISTFSNQNLLLLISHQVNKQPVTLDNDDQQLSKSRFIQLSNTETHVIGTFIPRIKNKSESFVQLQPTFLIYPNNSGRENFFNMDQQAIVVLFGEGDQDLLFLNDQINKQSYLKTNRPELGQYGDQPQSLKVWVLSDEPIDLGNFRESQKVSMVEDVVETAQPVTTYTTTSHIGQNSSSQQVVVERKVVTNDYYVTSNNPQYYSQVPIKDVK